MSDNEIIVIGYPKSGNSWLSRLLGDALDSPVTGYKSAVPLATEGDDRTGEYIIRQLHLHLIYRYDLPVMPSAWEFNLARWSGEKLIHIIRDPRDVSVSAYYYWQMQSVLDAVNAMGTGTQPLRGVGEWVNFVESWWEAGDVPVYSIFYERLVEDTAGELLKLLETIEVEMPLYRSLQEVIQRQSLEEKRKQIKIDGNDRPYGRAIQLRNLRKGVAGDWKNHYDKKTALTAEAYFGDTMAKLGYESDRKWWQGLPEKTDQAEQ